MSLHIIIGCMFSGKSTELIKRIKAAKEAGTTVLNIVHALDSSRYATSAITTHDQERVDALALTRLTEVSACTLHKHDLICIEEAQFFSDLYDAVFSFVNDHGKQVIVCGLDGDYLAQPFTNMMRLIPIADSIIKLTARCVVCGKAAMFSKRICADANVILIGGSDKYQSVCRQHFYT
jgi:thymidine kinase